jgi:hypothetical protein
MSLGRLRSSLLVSALATLAVAALPMTATASPVFTDAATQLNPGASASTSSNGTVAGTSCQVTSTGGTEPSVPVVENGPAVTASTSINASFVDGAHPTDTASALGTVSASGAVTSTGGNLRSLDLTGQGSATFSQAGTSGCNRYAYNEVDLDYSFTVAQAGFLTVGATSSGGLYGEAYLYRGTPTDDTDDPYVDMYGYGLKFSGTQRVYLTPGTYSGYFEAEPYVGGGQRTSAGTVAVHATFAVAGAQTDPVNGKGKQYVTLPSARTCASHTLTPTVATRKKTAAKVKSVSFYVNDAKVKKVKTPAHGDAIVIPVADDSDAVLRAEVTLLPAHRGRAGKVLSVTSTYEACS